MTLSSSNEWTPCLRAVGHLKVWIITSPSRNLWTPVCFKVIWLIYDVCIIDHGNPGPVSVVPRVTSGLYNSLYSDVFCTRIPMRIQIHSETPPMALSWRTTGNNRKRNRLHDNLTVHGWYLHPTPTLLMSQNIQPLTLGNLVYTCYALGHGRVLCS